MDIPENEVMKLIETWHHHAMSIVALAINLTTIVDNVGYEFSEEEAEVFAKNLEMIVETASPLDGGNGPYTEFVTDLTEAMEKVFRAEEGPNRNLI
jgi:hypothetical protein